MGPRKVFFISFHSTEQVLLSIHNRFKGVYMKLIQPRTPSGFTEYLPNEQLEFNRLLDIIKDTYARYGFSPLDTPILELSEVLLAKGGGETEQQVYRFEHGRNDLTMRYDLTVPLARYVAEHEGTLVFPFRRSQIGKVYRAERAQAGRFREFYQCDIDVIGSDSPIVDAELPAIINEIFTKFAFGEFTIRLNDRRILNGFFESIGLSNVSREILRSVDKMEKVTQKELVKELQSVNLDNEQIERILDFTSINGTNNEIISKLRAMNSSSSLFNMGVDMLEALIQALRVMNVPENHFKIDLKIARGLDYYTGTVYETILNDYPEIGSVCSGGRYDNLAEYYTKTSLPGVGISIGLTRLFYTLREIGVISSPSQSPAKLVVMPIDEQEIPFSIALITKLREVNIAALLYTERNPVSKKLRYADRMGFEYALVIGANEVESNTVSLKNMKTGDLKTISLDMLAEYISNE